MDKYPYEVMEKLDSILKDTDRIAWMFSKTPDRNFSRHRKLPFHRLVKVLIGMEGNSLSHEMLNQRGYTDRIRAGSAAGQTTAGGNGVRFL